jgi:hypothetical protein
MARRWVAAGRRDSIALARAAMAALLPRGLRLVATICRAISSEMSDCRTRPRSLLFQEEETCLACSHCRRSLTLRYPVTNRLPLVLTRGGAQTTNLPRLPRITSAPYCLDYCVYEVERMCHLFAYSL